MSDPRIPAPTPLALETLRAVLAFHPSPVPVGHIRWQQGRRFRGSNLLARLGNFVGDGWLVCEQRGWQHWRFPDDRIARLAHQLLAGPEDPEFPAKLDPIRPGRPARVPA